MSRMNRRGFLKHSLAATAGSYVAMSSFGRLVPRVRGANDEVRIAVAGIRSRGGAHAERVNKYLTCSYREPFVVRDSV